MTRLFCLTLMAAFALVGCNKQNGERPVDGRDTDGLYEPEPPSDYQGRVMDGYLQQARVWLDLDGDSQYDSGSVQVVIGGRAGCEISTPADQAAEECLETLSMGEPTALTGEGGRFTLDVTGLALPDDQAADLDPNNYPLVAVAIPGRTLEETEAGNQTINHAFRLTSPPGERVVSPLTTLVDARRTLDLDALDVTEGGLAVDLSGVNPLGDYIQRGDARARAYGEALTRLLQIQFPDDREQGIIDNGGRLTDIDRDADRVLRLGYVSAVADVVGAVDAAAQSDGYGNVDISGLALPTLIPDLNNPLLLKAVVVETPPDNPTAIASDLTTSSRVRFQYDAEGVLQAIEADGCLKPSLYEVARLARVNGRVAELNVQGFEGFFLASSPASTFYSDDGDVDERLTFDWTNGTAELQSTTSCHGGQNGSELGGAAEQVLTWTISGDTVTVRDGDRELVQTVGQGIDPMLGYTDTDGTSQSIDGAVSGCGINDDAAGEPEVISGTQPYTYEADETGAGGDLPSDGALDSRDLLWDQRFGHQQLLRRVFFDTSRSSEDLLKWQYRYRTPAGDDEEEAGEQANLLDEARLSLTAGTPNCGGTPGTLDSGGIFANLTYEYHTLAESLLSSK
ncbi:hypothetical protein CF392_02215 [Tamilnaduibacter salinus]|uniref:Lipoprotein n=1 Tax=Tamilnaduibacter salinus TaxID=1484056 RepID=A0A2A2I7L2_9GAMM|nr:hypothetical protein [Tamilnaduibacter salinus]PAV27284.1 hypothetical protein CF392_02215 [Tamilnaduibacter salinus]